MSTYLRRDPGLATKEKEVLTKEKDASELQNEKIWSYHHRPQACLLAQNESVCL